MFKWSSVYRATIVAQAVCVIQISTQMREFKFFSLQPQGRLSADVLRAFLFAQVIVEAIDMYVTTILEAESPNCMVPTVSRVEEDRTVRQEAGMRTEEGSLLFLIISSREETK